MKNFILSIIVAVLGFGLGYWGANESLIAGIPTSLLAFTICYFILARRSFAKVTELSKQAMDRMQSAQNSQEPDKQLSLIDQTIIIFEEGYAIGKEQFLVTPTIRSQVGALHYQAAGILMQLRLRETLQGSPSKAASYKSKAKKRFAKAKEFFQEIYKSPWMLKATKNWHPLAMLAIQEHREGNKERSLEILKDIKGAGSNDPLFYGLYAWILHNSDKQDKALLLANEGCEKHGSNEGLQTLRNSIQNKKNIDLLPFGQNWFAFFPEHLDQNMMMRIQGQMMANNPEYAQQMNRAQRRALKKRGQ